MSTEGILRERSADSSLAAPLHLSQKKETGVYGVWFNSPWDPIAANLPTNYIRTTKYTLWSFLPLNLFNQFRRYYNLYFLLSAILSLIPVTEVLNPVTAVLPLLLVLAVTAIKDAVEDYARYKADRKSNSTPYDIIRKGKCLNVLSMDILPGDLILLPKNCIIPADCVLISSEYEDGTCFVETSQLDGETNLKRKQALEQTCNLVDDTQLCTFEGRIQCEQPNEHMHTFDGRIEIFSKRNARKTSEIVPRSHSKNLDRSSSEAPLEPSTSDSAMQRAQTGESIALEDFGGGISRSSSQNSTEIRRKLSVQGKRASLSRSISRVDSAPIKGNAGGEVYPLTINQVLLRGCIIRNTESAYAVVVYAGVDTKIMKNLKNMGLKFSSLEGSLNNLVLSVFIFNLVTIAISAILAGISQMTALSGYSPKIWYLLDKDSDITVATSPAEVGGLAIISFFILYSYMIPISLFVTIEIARLLQAFFMMWDLEMRAGEDNRKMHVRNSNLNEELGNVRHIFSDKTGTLTRNEMILSKWFVQGQVFDEEADPGCLGRKIDSLDANDPIRENFIRFCRLILMCNTVLPTKNETTNEIVYESQSPDEAALLNGLKTSSMSLVDRTRTSIEISIKGLSETYEILNTIEFTSDRKRQSIILKSSEGYVLLCKGADNIITERLRNRQSPEIIEADKKLGEFSNNGLRTLMMAWRLIPNSEYEIFKKAMDEAERSLSDREKKIADAAELAERDLMLLGCSAIEDRLQDQVPETLEYLLKCGIHIWLLTGDKQETAINIGMSSRLINQSMELFILDAPDSQQTGKLIQTFITKASQSNHNSEFALVINGATLIHALDDHPNQFLALGDKCHSVICCRVTPLQKARVVGLVKRQQTRVTLAIGDGANDVSMIQQAHIGVGIAGKEGTQAVRASDYSFSEFKCLKKLITVHGRWSSVRLTDLIYVSFYKNMTFIMVQFFYGIFSMWSASTLFQDLILTLYNVIYTSLPPLFIAIFEKDLSLEKIKANPEVFIESSQRFRYNMKTTLGWFLNAGLHTGVISTMLFVYFGLYEDGVNVAGQPLGGTVMMYTASTLVIFVVMARISLQIRHWTWLPSFAIILSVGVYVATLFVTPLIYYGEDYVAQAMFSSPGLWLLFVVTVVASLTLDYALYYFRRDSFPYDWQIIQEQEEKTK